jgi:hypothetical protein
LLLSLPDVTAFIDRLKVRAWSDFMRSLRLPPVSFWMLFVFWHRLPLCALLLTKRWHLHSQQLFAVTHRFYICSPKYWWWCLISCPHEPEGAVLLSAKNDSDKVTEKCDWNYGPFRPTQMRHSRLSKQLQWVSINRLLVVNTVTKNGYFW